MTWGKYICKSENLEYKKNMARIQHKNIGIVLGIENFVHSLKLTEKKLSEITNDGNRQRSRQLSFLT